MKSSERSGGQARQLTGAVSPAYALMVSVGNPSPGASSRVTGWNVAR